MAERPTFGEVPERYSQQPRRPHTLTGGVLFDGRQWQQQQFLDTEGTLLLPLPEHPAGADTLHDAIAPYVDLVTLRRLAAQGEDIRRSFRLHGHELPEELTTLFATIKALLRPPETYQIKSPHDMAAYLMLDMGFLDQEQLKVACLDTKNHLQTVHMVYQGSLNSSLVRVAEVFREPIKLNSAAVIIAHNHPSSDPTPSQEDVLVTQEIVAAGKLLDIDVLDHLVIGQGQWVSMREKGLGWNR